MGRKRRSKKIDMTPFELSVESLSHEGRGVGHRDGKAVFVEGALPGETVVCHLVASRNRLDEAVVDEVLMASDQRVKPACSSADICGGCSLQHVASQHQIALKEQVLRDQLKHFGDVQWHSWLDPLIGPTLGYRTKARLGVKLVPKKGGVLVGFREKRSSFVAAIDNCPVLDPRVGEKIDDLRRLVESLSCPSRIPQIEVSLGDHNGALIIRHLDSLTDQDKSHLSQFGLVHRLDIYLQPDSVDSVHKLFPSAGPDRLHYSQPKFDLNLAFHPTDFTQVNPRINRMMVEKAVAYLDIDEQDTVLDLFCGLGNFTLPLARRAKLAVGVEGCSRMVERGYENAQLNGLSNVEFHSIDLHGAVTGAPWLERRYDKVLLDPPRSGALDVVGWLPSVGADTIVYVSCSPSTLARDAGILCSAGYELQHVGIMDMFPHTTHVESMAVFCRRDC